MFEMDSWRAGSLICRASPYRLEPGAEAMLRHRTRLADSGRSYCQCGFMYSKIRCYTNRHCLDQLLSDVHSNCRRRTAMVLKCTKYSAERKDPTTHSEALCQLQTAEVPSGCPKTKSVAGQEGAFLPHSPK